MAQGKRRGRPAARGAGTGPTRSTHEEALPTRRLVAADAAKSIVVALIIGCALALVLDVAVMLVATAVVPESARPAADRVGRGIVAASSIGILVFALTYGYLATAARLALARFYSQHAAQPGAYPRQLRDTVTVRGQANPSPYTAAIGSTVTLGGLALLAALVCIVLATEHGGRLGDELHTAEFSEWVTWAGAFLAAAILCAALVRMFVNLGRRWRDAVGAALPPGVVGEWGPATRVTTRAQRRAARRGWRPFDWWACSGGVLTAIGASILFIGVYLHQPGLYAEKISYDAVVERVLDTATAVGGAVLALGMLVVAGSSVIALAQTARSLRRARANPKQVSGVDQIRVRAATETLSNAVTSGLTWWAVFGAVTLGWWFAILVTTPADGGGNGMPAPMPRPVPAAVATALLAGWAALGVLLAASRVALEANGPALRNRFGYQPPSEPDDREYPDLTLFGQ